MNKYLYFIPLLFIGVAVNAQTIINQYSSVLNISFTICNYQITVDDPTGFNIGDEILIIQMKGAEIDTSNTATFGQMINWHNVGNYEVNKIGSINGSVITLKYALTKSYDVPDGIVQVVKIPHYTTYTVSTEHTCLPWNGKKGGVFAIMVDNDLVLKNNISVLGNGFTAGIVDSPNSNGYILSHQADYCYSKNKLYGAQKGEGITSISNSRLYCRGPLFNGGGGANSHNSGGGGGGNAGAGGHGGAEWWGLPDGPAPNGGLGGMAINYSATNDRLFLAGGGGAGHENDDNINNGGRGGGLIFILAGSILGNNNSIIADGVQGVNCNCTDGVGGGGGGGTVLINSSNVSGLNVSIKGGNGATVSNSDGPHGPGGGGGGGVLLVNDSSILSGISYNYNGGAQGRYYDTDNSSLDTAWGTTPGDNGAVITGFIATIDTTANNLPVVNIADSQITCGTILFTANAKSSGITSYEWQFGDGKAGSGNSITHTYTATGIYTVKLIVSNGGCMDSFVTKPADIQPAVFMPGAFTPNGDGKNDKIYPIIYCNFIFSSLHIYNRWGQEVFETKTYGEGWDGKYRGVPCEIGTYYYFIKGTTDSGDPIMLKGDIMLIR
ncbi:MAG TPA: gliding motility-associated C-terminal domain-containing protein [Flavipsychrobacter sp.]|nr:gliding motility-associated C-terminal domain-containing protein [Flavipsychrobacter sp.]